MTDLFPVAPNPVDMARAHQATAADPALSPVPYTDRERVIGRTATADLLPGTLLTRDATTDQRLPPPGQQLVGIGLPAVQLPGTPLRPGDDVLLVPLPTEGQAAPTASSVTVAATVVRAGEPGTDGRRVVDVLVDEADGPDVAARAAAGLVALVVVAGE